jgi:hypothetical protein
VIGAAVMHMAQWEYATISYGQEGDLYNPGRMMWAAYIKWPGAEKLDVRDNVKIADLLNELGHDGWELFSEKPGVGVNVTDYLLKRQIS